MSITFFAEAAVQEILDAGENGPRSAYFGTTLLNRKFRVLRAIRKRYVQAARQLHQSEEAISQQWRDVKELVELEYHCEGADSPNRITSEDL